jgi:N-terminal half of MaoC dehydratase
MTAERFPIEAGHIMAFARAIGDFNPVYHGAVAAGSTEVEGIIAPPTFVQAAAQYDPEYPLRPRPGVAWFGSGRTPSGRVAGEQQGGSGGGTALHAEQHYEYHRPVRPGEVLSVTVRPGGTWEKEGRRGGTLRFQESVTEFRDADGDLVVVARSVGVRTDRTVT